MPVIEVKAKPGRVARTSKDGEFIPEDRYVRVQLTPYIDRLLNIHQDIEQRPPEQAKELPKAAPKQTAKVENS